MRTPLIPRQWIAALAVALLAAAAPTRSIAQETEPQVDPAQKQLLAAGGLYQRGLFKLARQEYEVFLEKYPQHDQITNARYALSICQYRLGQFDEAVKLIEQTLTDATFQKKDEALAVVGHCHLSLKQPDKALAAFEQLMKNHADSPHAQSAALNRAQVLYMLDRKPDALAAARTMVTQYRQSANRDAGLYLVALCQHDLGQFKEASDSLDELFKDYPQTAYVQDATYLRGQCFSELGQYDQAIASFQKMLESAPVARRPMGLYSLGVAYYRAANYDEAAKMLEQVLKDFEDDRFAPPARLQLGLTQLAADDVSKARKTLEEVQSKDEQRRPTARYWLAQCDIREKKYDAALRTLDELAGQNPPPANIEQIAFDRAACHMALSHWDDAGKQFAAFREAYAASGQIADATYRHAFCLHKQEQYEQSLALCQQVTSLPDEPAHAPAKTPAAKLAAENLFLLSRYDQAAAAFTQLTDKADDPFDQRHFTLRRAQCAAFDGRFDDVIGLLAPLRDDKQVAEDARLHELVFVLGDAQLQRGMNAEAAATIDQYVKLSKSDQPQVQFKLGLALLRSDRTDEAKAKLKQVAGGDAGSPWVQRASFEYGQLAYNQGDVNEAEPALRRVLTANPPAPEALTAPATYLLAWIDADAKRFAAAADKFASVVAKHPNHELAPDALFQQAVCLKQADQIAKALEGFQQYITRHASGRHVNEAKYQAGVCLAALDRHKEAIELFAPLAQSETTRSDRLLYDLAWSQRATDAKPAAEQSYQQLVAQYPQSELLTAVRAELAELLSDRQQYGEAAALLEQAVADADGPADTLAAAQYRLAWCYKHLKQTAKAAPAFGAFADKHPKRPQTPSALYEAGDGFATLEKHDEAEKYLSQMLKDFPDDEAAPVAMLRLGQVRNDAGRFPQAAQVFQQFLAKHAADKFAYLAEFGLGWALENQNQHDEARKWYARVIEHHNGETAARAQFQIGETYFKQDQLEPAVRELLKVEIVYDYPKWSATALYEAAQVFEKLKDLDQAKAHYQLCADKYQDQPQGALARQRLNQLR